MLLRSTEIKPVFSRFVVESVKKKTSLFSVLSAALSPSPISPRRKRRRRKCCLYTYILLSCEIAKKKGKKERKEKKKGKEANILYYLYCVVISIFKIKKKVYFASLPFLRFKAKKKKRKERRQHICKQDKAKCCGPATLCSVPCSPAAPSFLSLFCFRCLCRRVMSCGQLGKFSWLFLSCSHTSSARDVSCMYVCALSPRHNIYNMVQQKLLGSQLCCSTLTDWLCFGFVKSVITVRLESS